MKRFAIAAAATALSVTAAFAAVDVADLDTDGDNFVSEAEMMAAFPNFSKIDFNNIDTNDDNRVSSEELYAPEARTIVEQFQSTVGSKPDMTADTDGDGFLSFEELSVAYPGFMQTDFDDVDMNDDSRIGPDEMNSPEFQGAVDAAVTGRSVADVGTYDTDGDGFTSYEELSAALTGLNRGDFDEIDANSDGRLSADEFQMPNVQMVLDRFK